MANVLFLLTISGLICRGQEPAPQPLWPDHPPGFIENSPAEAVVVKGHIENVSTPALTAFLPPEGTGTGLALLVCPGGAYKRIGWVPHVEGVGTIFQPQGNCCDWLEIPHESAGTATGRYRLMDAKRALRIVRSRAQEWELTPTGSGWSDFPPVRIWR